MSFSISRALSDSFAIFKDRMGPMVAVQVMALIAAYGLMGAFFFSAISGAGGLGALQGDPAAMQQIMGGLGIGFVLLYLVIIAISLTAQAAMCMLCNDRDRPSIGDALSAGVRALPTLLGAVLLVIVGMIGAGIVIALVMAVAAMGAKQPWLIFILGLIVAVGGVYVMTKLSMVLPVVVLEGQRGPLAVIGRSWQLSRGNSLRLFGYFFLIMVVQGIVYFAVMASMGGLGNAGSGAGLGAAFVLMMIALLVFGLLAGVYWITAIVAAHRQLAGPSTEAIEDTFA